jgi:predicted double-glycine peptidase
MARFGLALVALAAAACVHVPPRALGVPAVRQATDYSCGPAALLAVLRYWRAFGGGERDLYAPLHTSVKDGTEPWALEAYARERGLTAQYRVGATVDELRRALAAGQTVILDLQAWRDDDRAWSTDWDDGHYVVLIAMDARRLYVMDPSADSGYAWLELDDFVTRWHDYVKEGDRIVRLQHMAVFVAGTAHGEARPRRPEKMR